MVNQTQKNVGYVNIAARTILQLALDKRDPKIAPKLHNELKKLHTQDLKSRMKPYSHPKVNWRFSQQGQAKRAGRMPA